MAETPERQTESVSRPRLEMLAARRCALRAIEFVLGKKQAFDIFLESDEELKTLPSLDRAFVRMISATTLRRMGQLDDLIARATDRAEPPNPPKLHYLLYMAAAQIAFMDVPDYAVVDTSVEIAELEGMGRQKGFVNAVLRRIAAEHRDWTALQDAPRLNTPEWLMKIWIEDYGLRGAAEIAQANMSEAPVDISVKDSSMAQHWAEALGGVVLPTGTVRCPSGGQITGWQGFDDGMWWVQDASAALPASLFGDVEGTHVIDLCAAPGGKTAQLLSAGAQVTAIDRATKRLKRLEQNMQRLRLEANVVMEASDSAVWQPKEKADFVLLDAPCSATGTVRRHPDVLRLKSERDLARLIEIQQGLLDNASKMMKPGGVLIYCTCSLQKSESEYQIDALLARDPSLRRLPVSPVEVGGVDALVDERGDVRVLPFHLAAHGGMDGFYISRLQKI